MTKTNVKSVIAVKKAQKVKEQPKTQKGFQAATHIRAGLIGWQPL